MKLEIRPAVAIREVAAVKRLWREYWAEFGFTPCFEGFEEEVESLPGKYQLLLAWWDGEPAGTVAWHGLEEKVAEFKRLYVRGRFRSKGIGRALMERLLEEVARAGYERLVGETMPEAMAGAMALYRALGFRETAAYGERAGGVTGVLRQLAPQT